MLAVGSLLAGVVSGVIVGVLIAQRMARRPSRQVWLLLVGLTTCGVIAEVWFIFVYLRNDEGVRTNLAPLIFLFLWTLALAAGGAGASALRVEARRG